MKITSRATWVWSSIGDDDTIALTASDAQDCLTMHSSSSSYKILDFIGEGSFGTIVSSMNLRTKQIVAVTMLKVISDLDVDLTNMVRFHEAFQHLDQTCLVFERLDMSLFDLLKQREWEHRPLDEIRPVAKQLLVALDALKGLGVLHADIKPDNVMFVNRKAEPFRVKFIDFGCAMMASEVQLGMDIQPCGYMAPEISLGLPITEAIDVWGVGCVLAFMYLAQNLFPNKCEYQMIKTMVTLLGLPQDHLLRAGRYSNQFFIEEEGEDGPSWRLMTAEEFTASSNLETEEEDSFIELPNSLNDLIHIHPKLGAAEMEDRKAFVSLLEGLLHLDGDERISPCQALELPFISMSHLRGDVHSRDYLNDSQEAMGFCPTEDSVHWSSSDSGSSGSLDQDSWDSVEALDSTSATDELSWCSDSVIESTDTACLPTFNESSEVFSKGSDMKINSRATWVWCPIMDDDTSEEVSWSCNEAADVTAAATASDFTAAATASDLTIVSTGTTCSPPFSETSEEVSWSCVEAADVSAASKASSGGKKKKKWLKRIRKFFSSLLCCCCPQVED
ncbi:unnamed protein product [Pleuronectes platessa]|uniref:Protein kinase domain-containing protein n=1 Tax=Pleuronectes platessa TaxID=8262 RepID=A0A9N7UBA4_PLEPL|nr:unnamed protein product [Pleuronectes platessa]